MITLRQIPIRRSLIRPNLIMGCERELLSYSGMFSAMIVLTLMQAVGIFCAGLVGFGIWSALLYILTQLGHSDPLMSKVYLKHIKYRIFYPAHGRFDAPLRHYRTF